MEPFVGHARRIFARSVCKRFLGRLQFVQIPYFSLPKRWCASSVASTLPQRARLPTRCSGCGVTLQCADANSLGYFKPPSSLQSESGVDFGVPEAVALVPVSCICQRCHRAKHYGHLVPVTLPYKEFQETLKSIIARLDVAMVAVLDVTDIHGSVLPELARAHGRVNDIVFAVNKCDVLPTSALKHLNRLDIWVRTELRRMGFPSGLQLHLISSKTGAGFKDMMASIKAMQKGRDVYVIGAANVGKSTLVNRMVAFAHGTTPEKALGGAASALTRPSMATQESDESLEEAEEESTLLSSPFATAVAFDSSRNARRSKALVTSLPPFVTSSPLPGTTVTVVSVPFIGATALHDTPGVVVNQQKQDLMESLAKQGGSDCVRRALLLKQKHAPTYRLSPGRSLFLGGLARLDYDNTDKFDSILVTWFGQLDIHTTSTARADEVWAKHKGGLLAPAAGELTSTAVFELKELLMLPEDAGEYNKDRTQARTKLRARQAAVDIVLSGFGWLAITPTPVVGTKLWHNTIAHGSIKMTAHPGVPLFLRHPMLPYEADGTSPGDWKT